jgi:hypothetical protein
MLTFALIEDHTTPKGSRVWRDAQSTLILPRMYQQDRSISANPAASSQLIFKTTFKVKDSDANVLLGPATVSTMVRMPNATDMAYITGSSGVYTRHLEIISSTEALAALDDLGFFYPAAGYNPA